ncbi:MAG: AMP-binding protein [Caulobacteraceae bacterium]|nr:AMP-binding protein [Caulobacteraceae bacterium]
MADAFANTTPLLPEIWALHGRWRASRPAVESWDGTLTWAELMARSNQVGAGLRAIGLSHGDRAAVLMSNSLSTVEVLVGLMRAGIAAVPVNPGVTDAAVAAMMRDAGVRALFLSEEHAARDLPLDGLVDGGLIVRGGSRGTDYHAWRDGSSDSDPGQAVQPDDLCNIIYSSGTTGMPKGIVHTHGQRLAWAQDVGQALRYHSGARTAVVVGLHSNISWVSLLCTLMAGGTVLVERAFDGEGFFALIRKRGVTHVSMVPLLCQRLLEAWPDDDPHAGRGLQSLMCCGSPLPAGVKAALLERLGGVLIELYGSTEGVITTLDPEDAPDRLASVGKPVAGGDILILGADDRPAPPGEAGEIVGRGRFSMDGYWNRPDATAEATWTDPQGRPWLRTGDIGRVDEEGFLYVVDRKKDMILSGGQNVYPADVEAILFEHPGVAQCAVVGAPSRKWGETPVAFVVPAEDSGLAAPDLRDWLNARLARFQKVAAVHLVDDLPRNATGKVLKRELRAGLVPLD